MASLKELNISIEKETFMPLYLFYGSEKYLAEELVELVKKSFLEEKMDYGYEKADGNEIDLAAVLERSKEQNLFSSRHIYHLDEPAYLSPPGKKKKLVPDDFEEKEKNKILADLLEDHCDALKETKPESIIIFTASRVDKRKKIFKVIEKYGLAVECSSLRGPALMTWINDKVREGNKRIERKALESLLLAGNQDLYYLANEIAKYVTYAGDEEIITAKMVEMLFAGDLQGDVFKLADALAEKKVDRAQLMLKMLLRRREKPLMIFFMITRHFRLLLQTKSLIKQGVTSRQLAQTLGVPSFVARKLLEQIRHYNLIMLENIIVLMQKTDLQIKTGSLDAEGALFLLLSKIDYLQTIYPVNEVGRTT